MDYQPTENQIWAQTLLYIVYQPMVANKTGRYSLKLILRQFSANERAKFKAGIDALVEMGIFVVDGTHICITNKSESLFQVLNHMAGKPADEVEETLKDLPALSSILATINGDSRLAPPSGIQPTSPGRADAASAVSGYVPKPISMGGKIFMGVFFAIILLGLMKVIFRY